MKTLFLSAEMAFTFCLSPNSMAGMAPIKAKGKAQEREYFEGCEGESRGPKVKSAYSEYMNAKRNFSLCTLFSNQSLNACQGWKTEGITGATGLQKEYLDKKERAKQQWEKSDKHVEVITGEKGAFENARQELSEKYEKLAKEYNEYKKADGGNKKALRNSGGLFYF